MHLNQAFKKVKQIWYFSMVKLKEYFRFKFRIFLWVFLEQNRSKIKCTKITFIACQDRAICWLGMILGLFCCSVIKRIILQTVQNNPFDDKAAQASFSDSAFCWIADFHRRIVSNLACRVFLEPNCARTRPQILRKHHFDLITKSCEEVTKSMINDLTQIDLELGRRLLQI